MNLIDILHNIFGCDTLEEAIKIKNMPRHQETIKILLGEKQ